LERLFVKRDDLTGFSLGGNKVRKLEYLIGDAMASGCDTVLALGGPKSNMCQTTAEAARVAGLACEVVLYGDPPQDVPVNLALIRTSGAHCHFTGDNRRSSVDDVATGRARQLARAGRSAYVIPRGGASAVGAVGYHDAVLELANQLVHARVDSATVFVGVGSGGTLAGLAAGATQSDVPLRLMGASVSRTVGEGAMQVERIAAECAALLDLKATPALTEIVDARGPGYGKASAEAATARDLGRASEAMILDPVYTAKTLAALTRLARQGLDGTVVFWHTGGIGAGIEWAVREAGV
jgi:D-cysteine desulfhydrase